MPTPAQNKYKLKSLHEEIDLFDRKLAHLLKYESFPSDAARKSSAGKMQAKRDLLAQTARQLASEGVEFNPSELPRSFRDPNTIHAKPSTDVPPTLASEALPDLASDGFSPPAPRPVASHFAGTVLDGQAYVVEAYKRNRSKLSS